MPSRQVLDRAIKASGVKAESGLEPSEEEADDEEVEDDMMDEISFVKIVRGFEVLM